MTTTIPTVKLGLTKDEIEILTEALPAHIEHQLPDECAGDNTPERLAEAQRLADEFPRESSEYTADEVHELSEACDSYLYWEVSDPDDRNDGFVFYEGADYEDEAKEIEALQDKLAAVYHASVKEA